MYCANGWVLLCQVLSSHLLPRLSSLCISVHILYARVCKCANVSTFSFTLLSVCAYLCMCVFVLFRAS
jgi:hypothetical protein